MSQARQISNDVALRLLADRKRRSVLDALVAHPDNVVSVQALADRIDLSPASSTRSRGTDRRLTMLRHDILPRLDDVGLVEYDWRSETVRYRPDEDVERLLAFVTAELE